MILPFKFVQESTHNFDQLKHIYSSYDSNILKIIHFNIRSLKKNFNLLHAYLSQVPFSFDLIILSEVFEISNPSNFSLQNYFFEFSENRNNKNSGTAIYISSKLKYSPII